MAFGAALLENAQAALNGAKAAYSNAVKGPDFNLQAYNEAQKEPGVCVEADCFEEDWNVIEKPRKRRNSSQSPFPSPETSQDIEPYLIRNTQNLSQIRLKITRTATTKAAEAADVSLNYAKWALKLAALEAAHDIGFLSHCRTATEAINFVKSKFPVLEDMQRAFYEGTVDAGADRGVVNRGWGVRDAAPSSYLDGPIYDPETRAEVEIVYEPVLRKRPPRPVLVESDIVEEGGVALKTRDLDSSGPYIGDSNDSEELKAKEDGAGGRHIETTIEKMERRGQTEAVLKRLRNRKRVDETHE